MRLVAPLQDSAEKLEAVRETADLEPLCKQVLEANPAKVSVSLFMYLN
jgi:hypothetical protein